MISQEANLEYAPQNLQQTLLNINERLGNIEQMTRSEQARSSNIRILNKNSCLQ